MSTSTAQPATATSVAVITTQPSSVAPRTELTLTPEQVELVKRTVAKGATDDELALFLYQARRMGLDPLARQIHAVKRWDRAQQREAMAIQVGIDGYRLIAERTGTYCPGRAPTFETNAEGRLVSATAYALKLVGGQWHEISATAFYAEYVQTRKDGTPTSMWERMPRSQTAKCAEALVLRKGWPAELSGAYTHEEMAQAEEPATPAATPATVAADAPQPGTDAQVRRYMALRRMLGLSTDRQSIVGELSARLRRTVTSRTEVTGDEWEAINADLATAVAGKAAEGRELGDEAEAGGVGGASGPAGRTEAPDEATPAEATQGQGLRDPGAQPPAPGDPGPVRVTDPQLRAIQSIARSKGMTPETLEAFTRQPYQVAPDALTIDQASHVINERGGDHETDRGATERPGDGADAGLRGARRAEPDQTGADRPGRGAQ